LKYVFVTASPVLSNELRRFYSVLKETLVNHLRNNELKREKIALE